MRGRIRGRMRARRRLHQRSGLRRRTCARKRAFDVSGRRGRQREALSLLTVQRCDLPLFVGDL
jgi:hypothetical protein